MKVTITDDCISCGACVDVCPELFEMPEKAVPKMDIVPEELQDKAHVAAEACPVDAIILED